MLALDHLRSNICCSLNLEMKWYFCYDLILKDKADHFYLPNRSFPLINVKRINKYEDFVSEYI